MKHPVVALEGVCCAGKSTLLHKIKIAVNAVVIEEYGEYTSAFPAKPSSSVELESSLHFFQEVEARRYADFTRQAVQTAQQVVIDRSFLTCCAYDYAITLGTPLQNSLAMLEERWASFGQKIIPDLVVVLRINEKSFRTRLTESKKQLKDPFSDWVFNERFYTYLDEIYIRWNIPILNLVTDELNAEAVEAEFKRLL